MRTVKTAAGAAYLAMGAFCVVTAPSADAFAWMIYALAAACGMIGAGFLRLAFSR